MYFLDHMDLSKTTSIGYVNFFYANRDKFAQEAVNLQKATTLDVSGLTLRGMEHVPDAASSDTSVPAVILFHGFTGQKLEGHRFFWKMSCALEQEGIAAFRFDFSGSGESDGDFVDMTPSGEIREAKAILEMVKADPRIDATQVSLLGLSLGGFVAGATAGDLPDEVHRLVLLAPAGSFRESVHRLSQEYGVTADEESFDHAGNLVGKGLRDDVMGIDIYARSKPYQGPVLIMHGTKDEAVPYQVSEKYRDEVYGGRAILEFIDGADHTFNNVEWESMVISSVVEFIVT